MKRILAFIRELYQLYSRHNVPRAAGALAYFFLLSFFPGLLCLNVLVGQAQADVLSGLMSLERLIPREALELVIDYVSFAAKNQSPALLFVAVPAIVLSASAALRVLLDTMDELYGQPRNTGVHRIVVSVLFSLLFLVTVYLSILVILTGGWFLRWLERVLPAQLAGTINLGALSDLWLWLRYLLLFCFVMLLVLAVYRLGTPRQQVRRGPMLVSALLCALALVVASAVFSWFIGMSSRFSLLYGSLASMIVLLLWLYLCGTILLLGAALNSLWTKKHP